ncbi:hypothetical protein H5410_022664 [Solanum commersonii]|uniref:Uncharacterized protein n=1 Tax=Solanum commersonii TaxID=4109 RepID=A0A9J5ZHF5_SOLCO|nr:hypothetical protein H5410_022664 [Solanum commersonii]
MVTIIPYNLFKAIEVTCDRSSSVDAAVKPRYCLDTIIARNKVNQLKNRLEELDAVEDARIAQTTFYDQMAEVGQKGWWESIEQLNADEVLG